jgi:hypothetical protein
MEPILLERIEGEADVEPHGDGLAAWVSQLVGILHAGSLR